MKIIYTSMKQAYALNKTFHNGCLGDWKGRDIWENDIKMYIHKANKNSTNTIPPATSTERAILKFLQLHLNYLEGIYTAKFWRKHIPSRETREAEMTELPCEKGRKASISGLGQGKRQKMTQVREVDTIESLRTWWFRVKVWIYSNCEDGERCYIESGLYNFYFRAIIWLYLLCYFGLIISSW